MLTGGKVFGGETVPHVLAAVLAKEPDWSSLPPHLNPRLREVLERCLQKKPADRYRDIGDVKADLQRVLADPQGVIVAPVAPAPVEARPGLRASLPLVAATAAVCLVVAGAAGWFLRPAPAPEPRPVLRFPLPLPEGQSLLSPAGTIAISRDGTQVAYAAGTQLYLRRLGETEARPVPGAEAAGIGVAAPAFSPDGQWLAYVDASSLAGPFIVKRIPVTGGTPVPVFEAAAYIDGLSWPTAETMLFADTGEDAGIVRIPANGGAAEVLVAALDGEVLNGPQLLPGEEAVLFSRLPRQPLAPNRWNAAQIAIQSIGGDDRSIVWEGASAARYVPSGHLLYAQGATLFALAFDLESRTVSGGAVPIVEGVQRSVNGLSDTGGYALSDTGTLATVPGTVAVAAEAGVLAYVDRAGAVEALPVRPGQYRSPRVSPDGTQLAVEVLDASDQEGQIWIYDLSGNSQLRRLTQTGNNTRAIWSPDSQRVTFASQQNGAWGIYDQPADGSALAEQLLAVEQGPAYPESWSPDGQTLLFTDATTQGEWTVWTVTRSGGTAELLAGEVANHFGAAFSPDGRWVAYTGVDDAAGTGLVGVRVQPFPPTGVVRQVTQDGEVWPVWSASGDELFFRLRRDIPMPAQLMGLDVSTEGAFTFRNPRQVPIQGALMFANYRDFDLMPDGERFVMIVPSARTAASADEPDGPPRARIDVVLNWVEELKARVPVE
jgi:Tol biopolymer transport system component